MIEHMDHMFANGTYRGEGRWIDQKTEGRYTAQYKIIDGQNGSKVHEVERIFLKPDGTVAYEERSIVTFEPQARSAILVRIHGPGGDVSGPGYALDRDCHYDIDVTPDNHLEFTFRAEGTNLTGLGSATNKGNRTYWKESLDRL
jgi:hypothetical protein